jgi:hypothetical protein
MMRIQPAGRGLRDDDHKHVALKETAQQRRRRRCEFDVGCGERLGTSKHENHRDTSIQLDTGR